jgi:hypothetical protein
MTARTSLLAALLASLTACTAYAQGGTLSGGRFIDKSGAAHNWTITPTHALKWDNEGYIPVGGWFCPRWLAEARTEENWKRDTEALAKLKASGILDIIINPVVSAADLTTKDWQRLIDHLDNEGFRYGICFGSGINMPLSGTVVKPAAYRIADMPEGSDASWEVPDADAARYIVVDKKDATQIVRAGVTRILDGVATVSAEVGSAGCVGLLYPHKSLSPTREGSLPDVWSGFDAYRDRLLGTFGRIKFGRGLRFFLDPLCHPIGLTGETEFVVPDSPQFRLEWEAYLSRRYTDIDALMTAWGLLDRDIKDFKHAASLLPLWSAGRGVPFLLDTAAETRLQMNGLSNRYWEDFRELRNDSILGYMNAAADMLKREVADVPVVYTRTHHHRMFTNPLKTGGFDGIGIATYARGSALVTSGADSAYSQMQESARTMWGLVSETFDAQGARDNRIGYASKEALHYDLDWLRGIGARGFFVKGLQMLPEKEYRFAQLSAVPEQLTWLAEYSTKVARGLDADRESPHVLPFPPAAAGVVNPGPISSGRVWWVPSLDNGKVLNYGVSYAGYTLDSGPMKGSTVLWSLRGDRPTTVLVGDPRKVEVLSSDGLAVRARIDTKGKRISLNIGSDPVIFKTDGQEVLPLESIEDTLTVVQSMLKQAVDAKLPVREFEFQANRARDKYKLQDYGFALGMAMQALGNLVDATLPYTWREAEQAERQTFSEVVPHDAASGRAYLQLSASTRPQQEGYALQIRFRVPTDDTYTLWLAASPPGPGTSPFVWVVDAGQAVSSDDAKISGSAYLANRFVWHDLGRMALKAGDHTITIRVTDKAVLGGYQLAVDSFLATRMPFTPSGTMRPSLLNLPPIAGIAAPPPDTKTGRTNRKP